MKYRNVDTLNGFIESKIKNLLEDLYYLHLPINTN